MATASTRQAGVAFIVGVILASVGSTIFPGGPVFDSVDQTDFQAAIGALGDNAALGYLTTMMVIVGMLLHAYGVIGLFGLSRGGAGLQGPGLRFGIVLSVLAWGLFTVAIGKRLMVIHLMQRAGDADNSSAQELFEDLALTGHTEMAGLMVAFITMFPFASALVGLGLVSRFEGMDVLKLASYGLVAVGVAGLANTLIGLFAPITSLEGHLIANNIVLLVGSVSLLVIGIGMYQGRAELVPDDDL